MAKSTASASEPPTLGIACQKGFTILEVGPNRKKYHIHKALLIHHSEYFRAALEGTWKEAEENVIRSEDIEPFVVNVFVYWLYGHKLPKPNEWTGVDRLIDNEMDYCVAMVNVYTFGDRFLIPELRREVHNNLVDHILDSENYIVIEERLDVYRAVFMAIPHDRPILQLLVDNHCDLWNHCCGYHMDGLTQIPRSFMIRAMRRLDEKFCKAKEEIDEDERCYYEHKSDEELKACPHTHMRYEEETDYGFFGERYKCDLCSD